MSASRRTSERRESPESTVRSQLPPNETGPVPVSFSRSEPHWFGVAPPGWLLGAAAAALVVSLLLFVAGHWPYGLIFLGVSALLAAAFLETARRRPKSVLIRASADFRERAASLYETLRARAAASVELRGLERGLALIATERRGLLLELGAAAYRGDGPAEARARAGLAELGGREAELQRRRSEGLQAAGERIRQARLAVDKTLVVVQPPEHDDD